MYCTNCGASLPDDSLFCSKCGCKLDVEEQLESILEEVEKILNEEAIETDVSCLEDNEIQTDDVEVCEDAIPVFESEENNPKSFSFKNTVLSLKEKVFYYFAIEEINKKLLLILGIGILLIVLLITIIAIVITRTANMSVKATSTVIHAKLTEDGTAYLPLMNGKSIKIKEEVSSAAVTSDRKNIVVLLKDGTLYVTSPDLEEKHSIADDCSSISSIRNDGFLYKDKNDNVFRVLFETYSKLKLGKDVAVSIAENSTAILYATDDGNIYSLAPNSNVYQKISGYNGSVELVGISDNGKISVWVIEKDNVQTIVLFDGENKFTLGKVKHDSSDTYVTFSADQDVVVIINSYSDRMWIKHSGQEPIEAKLGAKPYISTIYTNVGYLEDTATSDISSLYIATQADTGANVYNVTFDGDRERVVSGVSEFTIANGKMMYLTIDNILYYAELKNSVIKEEERISSDVDLFNVSQNGQYIYYLKDGNKTGSLYCYKIGADEPQKISSAASCYKGSYYSSMYTTISTDGSTVWFMKDIEEIDGTYTDQGTLMMWSYGEKSAIRIASEVVNYSVTSGLDSGEINKDSFVFLKYSSVDSDENIFGNWMYFDGKEATRFATDVIK